MSANEVYAHLINQLQMAVHQITKQSGRLEDSPKSKSELAMANMLQLALDDGYAGCYSMASKRYEAIVGTWKESAQVTNVPV